MLADSMARVASARQLELLRTGAIEETVGAQRTPGLQIVIVQQGTGQIERTVGPTPMIEHNALDERMAELEPPGH